MPKDIGEPDNVTPLFRPTAARGLGLVATDRAGLDFLAAMADVEPQVPGEGFAERQIAVFTRAVQRLCSLMPVEDLPGGPETAQVEQAMILAQLAGHLLSDLDDRRKARAVPLVASTLCDATHPDGPPTFPNPFAQRSPDRPASA